jgi:hypothetical protein
MFHSENMPATISNMEQPSAREFDGRCRNDGAAAGLNSGLYVIASAITKVPQPTERRIQRSGRIFGSRSWGEVKPNGQGRAERAKPIPSGRSGI